MFKRSDDFDVVCRDGQWVVVLRRTRWQLVEPHVMAALAMFATVTSIYGVVIGLVAFLAGGRHGI